MFRVAVAAAVMVFAIAGPTASGAEAPELKLEILPAKVTVVAGKEARVLVVARNGGSAATGITLGWLDVPGLDVEAEDPLNADTLAPGAASAWEVSIAAEADAAAQQLVFHLDFVAGGVKRLAAATLDVASSIPAKLEDVATVEVKTTLESLDEQNDGVVYLVVTNKLATPLTVDEVNTTGPDSARFAAPTLPVEIGARQSTALEVLVEAEERVRPGKHLLLFDLHLRWADGQEARVITTHEAQIGVVGESAVLNLLGVPTFLLLPGFLLMVALATWWRLGVLRPGGRPQQPPFEFSKPDFWALAITASILIAIFYPLLGGVDYLRGSYGLRDVVFIWVASLLLGTAIWFVAVGFWWLWRSWRMWRTPTADDDAVTVLRRLSRQWLPLDRSRYVFTTSGGSYTGFLLQRQRDAANVWLTPRIAVAVKDDVPDGGPLLDRLQRERKPRKLAQILAERRADLDVGWDNGTGPARPYVKSAADVAGATEQTPEAVIRAS